VSLSAAWQDFDQKATRGEQRYQTAAVAQFERERDQVVAIVEDAVPSSQKAETDDEQLRRITAAALLVPYLEAALVRIAAHYDANGVFRTEWLRRFTPLVRQTLAEGARDVAGAIGVDFNVSNPRVQAVIRQRVNKLAGEVSETTLARVREVITEARNDGVGVSEISKRIRDDAFGGTITTSRARTIARTETVGALNEGEHLAAIESGVMQSKSWLTQQDARVRESHQSIDGERVPLGARFSNGLLYPGEHGAPPNEVINCRCTLLYHDEPVST
jgi:SPP1 gp7 family putative phage head morphogenesis protein